MGMPHTGCWPGKRVRVVLKSGRVIISRFKERTKTHVILEEGRYHKADIRAFAIYKPLAHEL